MTEMTVSSHIQFCPVKMKSLLKYLVLLYSLHYIEGSQSFRCDYKYSPVADGWFKHVVIPATWFDARLRCALEGAVLASPTTIKFKNELLKIVNDTSTDSVPHYEIFTGIHAIFAQGAYFTVDGIPLSKIPKEWASGEPNNKNNQESCLTMNFNGELADVSCEETRPFVCYRSTDAKETVKECGTIDPDYHLDTRTQSCYKFHTTARNFSRAFFTCEAEGGHLAIINNEIEATVLKELFAKYSADKIRGNFWKDIAFVGGHDWNEQWDFRTIHGETIEEAGYSKFYRGEPNNSPPGEHCSGIYRSGELNDLWCERPAAFICEKDPDYPEVCRIKDKTQKKKKGKHIK